MTKRIKTARLPKFDAAPYLDSEAPPCQYDVRHLPLTN